MRSRRISQSHLDRCSGESILMVDRINSERRDNSRSASSRLRAQLSRSFNQIPQQLHVINRHDLECKTYV